MRFLRQSLTGLFLLALTVALMLVAGQMIRGAVTERMARDTAAPEGRERVFAVTVQVATPQSIAPELVAFGEIRSRRSLEVRAKTSGSIVVMSPKFVDGGEVELGEVLIQVDPSTAEFSLKRAQNDLLDAQAEQRDASRNLELAQAELQAADVQAGLRLKALRRQSDLLEREVGTTAAVEIAELAVASANQAVVTRRQSVAQSEARVDQGVTLLDRASIALAEAERALTETTLHAGFTGTLSDVTVVKGRLVAANEKLATLIDANALEVAFRVSTGQYVRLLNEKGRLPSAEVTVMLDVMGQDLVATGVVTRESAVVGEGETGRRIYARLDAPRGMKPGDFVTVRVREADILNVVRLPSTALDPQNRVLVVGENDRLEAVEVRLLRRQNDHILVEGAAIDARQVVTRLTPLLGPGIRVKPLVSEAPEANVPPATTTVPVMVAVDDDMRAKLIAAVENNTNMADDRKARLLDILAQPKVPAPLLERLKSRMGG